MNTVCSPYNDAFAFFISGPGITGTPNMALVPGTTLPVEINTVNNGVPGTSGGVLSNCTSIGAGSPFTSYYLDNTGGTLLSYRGYTTKFRAFHRVTPCDTYHLKLAIVDAGNAIYDSGVFLEAGSLQSSTFHLNHTLAVGATINGIPNAIVKGCSNATIGVIATPAVPVATTITFSFGGTATLGADYTSPGSIVIPAGDTSATFTVSGIPTSVSGTKTVTIYLSSGCGLTDSIKINLLDTPSASILTPDTSMCSGSVNIRTTGSAGLTYAWTPPAGLSSTTVAQPIATPAATTTYTMTATLPGSGCPPIVREITISLVPNSISITTPNTSICYGSSLPISVTGTTGLSYVWTPATGLNSNTVQNPIATPSTTTTYSVTATSSGGSCPSSAHITITVDSIGAAILTPDTTECGSAFQIRVSGTPGLTYSWTPSLGLSSTTLMQPMASPSATTTYIMTASQPGGACPPIVHEITVTVNNIVINMITPDTTICYGDTVHLRVNGNATNLYHWTPDTSLSAANIQDPNAVPTTTTTYSVTGSGSDGGCPKTVGVTITVVVPRALILTPDTTICRNIPFRILTDTSLSCTYLWTPATGLNNSTIADPIVTTDSIRTYVLSTITNSGGCRASDTVTINVSGSGTIEFSRSDSVFCTGVGVSMVANGDIGTSGVIWSFGNGDSLVSNPVFYSYAVPGTYTVSVTSIYRGCPDTVKERVINVYAYPQVNIGSDTTICPGSDRILLYDHVSVGTTGASWLWSTGETNSSIFVGAPGVYYATVSVHGCETTDTVVVSNDCYLDIPNVFTPNGDGINDFFFPRQLLSKGLTYFSMSIFNRWGEMIFQTNTLDGRGWDGNFNGIPQPEGVFIFLIEAEFIDRERLHRQGNITLLR